MQLRLLTRKNGEVILLLQISLNQKLCLKGKLLLVFHCYQCFAYRNNIRKGFLIDHHITRLFSKKIKTDLCVKRQAANLDEMYHLEYHYEKRDVSKIR